MDAALALLKQGRLLSERQVKALCERARDILMAEDNVQRVPAPVTVCGEVRGHFDALLEIFRVGGEVPSTNYVFLGSYLNRRGYGSLLTFLLLLALKVRFPRRIYLCRGKHEARQMTQVYGFYDECVEVYGAPSVWRYCVEVFDALTLSCVIEDQIFCVHSGLSPHVDTFDDIRRIDRVRDVPHEGPMYDLLWVQPCGSLRGW
eukprot:SAG31_NODE_894_length_11172_cov_25.790572_1_plen_203_part_00